MPLQRNATLILALSICISSLAQDPEVLNSLTVPEGFTVELAASSDFTSYPMFMAFDDQGRLFIAESTGKDLSGKEMAAEPECQILRLEDTDGDGVYDTRTIFATELSLPMGVLWHQGSLFVASPPDFLRFDDNDGDGISDHREVLLTGWNVFNTASLHGPFLGPDGRLYLTHGRHGYKIETKEGEILEGLAARIWRCWPDGTGLERFAGGGFDNPVELTFTPGGEMIGTMTYFTDPRHGKRDALLHFVQGGVYPKPHDAVKEFIRTSPDFMPVMTEFSRIAPSGLERFRSSGFGAEYQGSLFSAQFNPHRVQRHKLIREGATFRTEDEDFLTSSYPDFYPTDILEDADGSLLVSDTGAWYVDACPISRVAKPQIKGAIYRIRKTSTTPHSDPWGNKIDWTSRTTQQLIEDLDDSRVRVQDRALQGLIAQCETAVPLLAEALKSNSDPQVRLLALTGLRQVIGEGRKAAILDALKDDSLDVRLKAIQAAGDSLDPQALQVLYALLPKGSSAELREVFTTLAKYPDPSVTGKTLTVLNNLETPADPFLEHAIIYTLIQQKNSDELFAALSASDSNNIVRCAALIALDQIDNADLQAQHTIPLLSSNNPYLRRTGLWVSSHHPDWADEVLAHLERELRAPTFAASGGTVQVLHAYMDSSKCRELIGDLLNDTESSPDLTRFLLEIVGNTTLERLPDNWNNGIEQSLESTDSTVRWHALDLIRTRGLDQFDTGLDTIISDDSESDLFRLTALSARAARLDTYTEAQYNYLLDQLTREDAPTMRQSAARLLSATELGKVRKNILASDYLPNADALLTISILDLFQGESDEALGITLVAGLQANGSFADFVNVGQLQSVFAKFSENVQQKAKALHTQLEHADAELIERFTRLEPNMDRGDVGRGRRIFFGEAAACSTCHPIGNEGGNFGPDLTTIGLVRSGHDLLEAIMFPSSSFVPDFTPYIVETTDDEVYIGIIARESAEGIVLKTGVGEERYIPRSMIAAMTTSPTSIMPEGLDSGMTDDELLDLMSFLRSLNDSQWLLPKDE